jgi:hypothetical protein
MSKMGLHDPFGHLKHKLWPKERAGVKVAVWLPTIKSQESTRFPCMQVACNTPLESSQRGLQRFFIPHPDRRSAHKVITPQSCGSPNVGNLGVLGQKAIWMRASRRGAEYTIRGKVLASPKSGPWWVVWVQGRSWFVLTPKVLQQCTNQFVWFCTSLCEWISVCHSS